MAPPDPSRADQPRDKVRALVGEYLDEQKRQTREVVAQAPRARSRALTAFSVFACATVWVLPAFVRPVDLQPDPARIEASARMSVYLAAQRVIAYQRAHGHLPADLAAAGADSAGLAYAPGADTLFEIRAVTGTAQVAYRSSESPADFLGNAFQVLGSHQ